MVAISLGSTAATGHILARVELSRHSCQRWIWRSRVWWSVLPECMSGQFSTWLILPPWLLVSFIPFDRRFWYWLFIFPAGPGRTIPFQLPITSQSHQLRAAVLFLQDWSCQSLFSSASKVRLMRTAYELPDAFSQGQTGVLAIATLHIHLSHRLMSVAILVRRARCICRSGWDLGIVSVKARIILEGSIPRQ